MIRANIQAVRDKLSSYLKELKPGDTLLICKHNKPIAELRKLPGNNPDKVKRVIPVETFAIPDSALFDPLPDEILRDFIGDEDPS